MAREIGGATVTTAEQDVVAYARHFKGALFLHMETGVAHAPVRRLSTATVPFTAAIVRNLQSPRTVMFARSQRVLISVAGL